MKSRNLSYTMIRKILSDLRKEFKESNKIIKIAELKKMEQESKIIKELENKYTSNVVVTTRHKVQ